jgi:hypothetical protein
VAKSAGLEVKLDDDYYTIFDPAEPTVTLDVKDADVRVILKSMQKECGIRNLVIDPNVNGSGTFLFRELPCRTAFRVVLRSLDLSVISYENDVVAVERRHSH